MPKTSEPSLRLKKRDAKRLLEFLHIAENLKNELRHSHTSKGRVESVAEHSWRTVLIAVLLRNYLNASLNWERLLSMIVIHDLAETLTGDTPIFEIAKRTKQKQNEKEAMILLRTILPDRIGGWLHDLWVEFESRETNEAKIVHALDKLEAQIQHNEADLQTWLEWEKKRVFGGLNAATRVNKSIMRLKNVIVNEAVKKLMNAGENIDRIHQSAKEQNRR